MEEITGAVSTETTGTEQVTESTSGVNTESTAAGLTQETGVKVEQSAAETDKVEKAFAARLKAESAKVESRARDAAIAEMGMTWKGKPITTYAEYQKAKTESDEEQRLQELVQQNIPEQYAKEMLENKKFREQFEKQQKETQEKQKKEADFSEFHEWYTKEYGKEPNPEDIPAEVWTAVEKGIPLKLAYIEYDYGNLKGKVQQVQQTEQIQQANQKNAESSTGSVKSNGQTTKFFTEEQVKNMTTNDVRKNLKAIEESRKHWK